MDKLVIKNLAITINGRRLIEEFSHHFAAGTIVALVGDNGSGKTTLLRTIAGLHENHAHQIFIDDVDIFGMSPKDRARIISFLLQHSPEQPYCSVKSRIAHGLMPTLGYHHILDSKTTALIEKTAHRLNIHHLLERRLSKMSGGEQRLVHIAKCLINPSTKVLLLDEPSVFLDFSQQSNLLKTLRLQKELGRLVIFSSHDAEFIKRVADFVITIKERNFVSKPIGPLL